MIRNKITRIVAGIISCIFVGIFAFRFTELVISHQKKWNELYASDNYIVSDEMNDIYYKLWAVGNMWLRNLDENGKFKGTEELQKQTVSALQELGCMDSKGNILLNDVSGDYEYLVSYGSNSFSNTDKSFDKFNGSYVLTRKNDSISYSSIGWTYNNNNFNMYDTNYGMHYYYLNGNGIALFDYDTTGLGCYIDELGATIYYKTDGSTPIPDEYYNRYHYGYDSTGYEGIYGEHGNHIESIPIDEIIDNYYDANGNVIVRETVPEYDENGENVPRVTTPAYDDGVYVCLNGRFVKVEQEKFKTFQLKELPLTIAVKPNDDIINNLKSYHDTMAENEKETVLSIMNNIPLLIIALILLIFVLVTGDYSTKEKKFVMTFFDRIFAEIPVALIVVSVICGVMTADFYDSFGFHDFVNDIYSEHMFQMICGVICSLLFGIIILSLNSLVTRIKCRCFWKTTFIYAFLVTVWGWVKKFRGLVAENVVRRDMLRDDKFTRRFLVRTVVFVIAESFFALVCLDWNAYGLLFFFSLILLSGYIVLSLLDLNAMNRISRHITAINSGDYTPHTENQYSSAFCITQKLNNISAGIQSAVDRQLQSERMKIDLVTNVSHDLKTPLTSIISYIDLLSMEELSPTAKDYVNIIINKSQRLKSMVADLFDLAKATSRTDVDVEKIDTVILANQVLADLSDKIESTGRQIKIDIQADSAPVMAEGKKMYRVLQNLIDNALKYSLDGTRIYFTLKNQNGYCVVNIKNIASYEMTFNPDEIIERFTRGDESRSTEGNGLGLSIAKSFTEACGGNFSIKIDGDVFTAEVKMPILMVNIVKE